MGLDRNPEAISRIIKVLTLLDITKKENRIIFFIIHVRGFKENSYRTQFDIALGNHALRMQPTHLH